MVDEQRRLAALQERRAEAAMRTKGMPPTALASPGRATAACSLVDSGATTAASASSSVDGRVSSWIAMFVLLSGLLLA